MSIMKLLLISLGCDKNLSDSEAMLGVLREHGYEFTDDESEADVIVINTCCFIHDAKEESINTIIEAGTYKEEMGGKCKALIVAGCLGERYAAEIHEELPEVDAIVGTNSYDMIFEAIDSVLSGKKSDFIRELSGLPRPIGHRIVTTGGHYAYLKIAEGCNKHCTYCIIPKIRGEYRSYPIEELVKEAERLAELGVKELILVAQETTLYGIDLYGEKSLHRLLKQLCRIDELKWIRILYCYPEEIDDALIDVIASEEKICKYLDIPIQHASDVILKRMGRLTSHEQLVDIISKLRERIPNIVLRTTLITGFPGESEEDHRILMDFVDEMEFDRLGVFTYSREENTAADMMDDQIEEDVKVLRQSELMELQQEISFEKAEGMVGKYMTAFIEGRIEDDDAYVARTYMDAPNVDGLLFIKTNRELMSGDMVKVLITGAYEYDLIGEYIDESAE